jgi:hypothetical protein
VRVLLDRELPQKALTTELAVAQSTISRAVASLKSVGLVRAEGLRDAPLYVCCRDEVVGVLLAADRLAEELLASDTAAQKRRSQETRRSAVRAVGKEGAQSS